MEFSLLVKKINSFNSNDDNSTSSLNHIDKILTNKVPHLKNSNFRGNQYALDQFNWELQKAEYYSRMRKEKLGIKKKEQTNIDTLDNLQSMLLDDQYSKKWNKLDLFCKKQKFKEYLKKLIIEKKIEEIEEKLYLNYLNKMLDKKILTKSTEVEYSVEDKKIIAIPILDKKIKAFNE